MWDESPVTVSGWPTAALFPCGISAGKPAGLNLQTGGHQQCLENSVVGHCPTSYCVSLSRPWSIRAAHFGLARISHQVIGIIAAGERCESHSESVGQRQMVVVK